MLTQTIQMLSKGQTWEQVFFVWCISIAKKMIFVALVFSQAWMFSWMISLKMLFCVTVAMIQESEEITFIDSHIEFITFNPSPITFYLAHYNKVVCFVGFDLKIYCKDLLLRVSTCNDRGTVTLLTDSTSYNIGLQYNALMLLSISS